MRHSTLGKLSVAAVGIALAGAGCEQMGGGNKSTAGTAHEKGGKVIDRSQGQNVNPDGSAVRTRTQMRQTPSGTVVRETQTEKREVVGGGESNGGQQADPTQPDPGAQ